MKRVILTSQVLLTYVCYFQYALYRLNQELKDMKKNPVSGIDVFLPSDSNIYLWHANLEAPSNSPYAGEAIAVN